MPGTLPLRQYDLVVCDIDGCLASEKQDPFDLVSLGKVRAHNDRAMERGDRPIVTVCSGRPQPYAEAICRLIGNSLMPAVCENGVWLYHPGTNVYEMDPAITPAHLAAVGELSAWARAELGPLGVTQQPGKAASVSLYHPDTKLLTESIAPRVQEEARRRDWPFRVSMTWYYINCDLTHISKSTALDRLRAHTGIPKSRTAGIGDTAADRTMVDHVAFFACPANAQPAIKEHAHYISPYAEAAGVVDILEHL